MTLQSPRMHLRRRTLLEAVTTNTRSVTPARRTNILSCSQMVSALLNEVSRVANRIALVWESNLSRLPLWQAVSPRLEKHRFGFSTAAAIVLSCGTLVVFTGPFTRSGGNAAVTWLQLPLDHSILSARSGAATADATQVVLGGTARRFRDVFQDPKQPLFTRLAAISPTLVALNLTSEPGRSPERSVALESIAEAPDTDLPKDLLQTSGVNSKPSVNFAGLWAPTANACSPKSNSRELLPAVISHEGAWAGDVSCQFRRLKQAGDVAVVAASCSNGRQRWTANVRLAVERDRLIWSSQRGSQTYVRCDPRIIEARAGA
jgi:hypothetical protein